MTDAGPGVDEPPGWLRAGELARVWRELGEALQRRELSARGRVVVRDLTRDERHALTDVLGHPVTNPDVRVDLGRLDARVAARLGRDLAETVTWVTGQALVDRAGRRRDAATRREAPFEVAAAWLAQWGQADGARGPVAPWVDAWLHGLRQNGILTPWRDAGDLIESALAVLADRGVLDGGGVLAGGPHDPELLDGPARRAPLARTELAARLVGDAHGLDDGSRLALLLLRAAAVRVGAPLPRSAADRQALWESLGVVRDRVSTTCLTWRLAPETDSPIAPRLSSADGRPAPLHLTWWDIEHGVRFARRQTVLVCENPQTLESVAGRSGANLGVVCTMGRPNLVVRAVLDLLVRSEACLHYHGDFDWAGIEMANACLRDFGARPWLMSVTDYLEGRGSQPLRGTALEADWDPELGPAMRSRGVAVHEEAGLEAIVRRLPELTG
ncbi:MAG: DUF2399 domain-containing protein [Micrococcales bacterium]|nr:DUF2399 domain-containing protein [Micrococcales bacterium]